MSFVYEEVGEKNKELWERIGFINWDNSPLSFYESRQWCVDIESDIYFYRIGSFRFDDNEIYCNLSYNSVIVKVYVARCLSSNNCVHVDVKKVIIPEKIINEKEEIKIVLHNAIKCCFEKGGEFQVYISYVCDF